MRLLLATGLLAAASVQAFSDSSPFVLFSTAKFASKPSDDQLQTSSHVVSSAKDILNSCSTGRYVLVSQPNLHATDLRGPSGCQASNLCRSLENERVAGRFSVAEVMGSLSFDDFSDYIRASCLEKGRQAVVEERSLKALPSSQARAERAEVLADNDYELGKLLRKVEAEGDYTILYFSSPNEFKSYQAEFADPAHIELKRQSEPLFVGRRQANESDKLPLFEKYQFFTPGVFMSFVVLFVLLSILYVGLTALSSLQVSYGSFDKEMGPTAHKKQQ